jgi:hypothetical protein
MCCGSAAFFGMLLAISVATGSSSGASMSAIRDIYSFAFAIPYDSMASVHSAYVIRISDAMQSSWGGSFMPDVSAGPAEMTDHAHLYLLLSMACACLRSFTTLTAALLPTQGALPVCLLEGNGQWAAKGGVSSVQRLAKKLHNPASSKRMQLTIRR